MIENIRLLNFKAFRRAEMELSRLTLLTGVNAVGKSTVLQALALLWQSFEAGSLAEEGLLLNGSLVELGTGADLLHEDFSVDERRRPFVEISIVFENSRCAWRSTLENSADRTSDLLKVSSTGLLPWPSSGHGKENSLFYLRADRIVPAVTYPKSYEMTVRRRTLGARGEHTVNFLRVHRDSVVAEPLRHPRATSSLLLDQVEAWLQDLCPGVNVEAADIAGADLVQLTYGFFARAGLSAPAVRYRPTNVGFGLTYALPIVVACLAAGSDALVLLENPEAHLHPRGQSALARLIAAAASAGTQLIVETHSDHILNGVRLAVKAGGINNSDVSIHYFSRGSETSVSKPVPQVHIDSPVMTSDGMLSAWPVGFFDEWDNAVDQLLDEDPS